MVSKIDLKLVSDEANAQKECEQAIKTALQIDAENIEALQSACNLAFILQKMDEAKALSSKLYASLMGLKEDQRALPSFDFRCQTARLLI